MTKVSWPSNNFYNQRTVMEPSSETLLRLAKLVLILICFSFGGNYYKHTHDPQFLHSLWQRTNARNVSFETLCSGQFTLSTQLITPNYPVLLQIVFFLIEFEYNIKIRIWEWTEGLLIRCNKCIEQIHQVNILMLINIFNKYL